MRSRSKLLWAAVVAALGLGLAGQAGALDEPRASNKDRRVRYVDYDPQNVVRVAVAMRTSFVIVFAKDEKIRDIAGGNTVAWEPAPSDNILFLKPRENHAPTNMHVVTVRPDGSSRVYQLELSSVVEASRTADTYYSLEYRYPSDEVRAAQEAARVDAAKAESGAAMRQLFRHEEKGPRNFAYTAQGSSLIEPAEVFDNGKVTSFRFPAQQEIPAIYAVAQDGSEQVVPKNVIGEITQVHVYAAKFVLRLGREVVCVTNENYLQGGLSTGTMTTSPKVERVIAGRQSVRARALAPMPPVRQPRARMLAPRGPETGSLGPVPVKERVYREVVPVVAPVTRDVPRAVVPSAPLEADRIVVRPQAGAGPVAVPVAQAEPVRGSGAPGQAGASAEDRITVRGPAASQAAAGGLSVAQQIARENMARQLAANEQQGVGR